MDYLEKQEKINEINREIYRQSKLLNERKASLSGNKAKRDSIKREVSYLENAKEYYLKASNSIDEANSSIHSAMNLIGSAIFISGGMDLYNAFTVINIKADDMESNASSSVSSCITYCRMDIKELDGKISSLSSEINDIYSYIRELTYKRNMYEARY